MFDVIFNAAPRRLRRVRFVASLAVVWALAAGSQVAQAADADLVVVELFTSQGCNSCPPADAFLRELTQDEDVLALSFPVDYWDYLGWKDTLADPANTERQSAYRQTMGLRQMYTPQMVIQGQREGVGSRTRDIQSKISAVQNGGASKAGVTIAATSDGFDITVAPKANGAADATVWLIYFDAVHEVAVTGGENSGRTLRYHNVVQDMVALGEWSGQQKTYSIPGAQGGGENKKCAVLVQSNGAGPILAAAMMP